MKRYWYVSTNYATGLVVTQNDLIIDTAPIWNKFIGQKAVNLKQFLSNKNKEVVIKEINEGSGIND